MMVMSPVQQLKLLPNKRTPQNTADNSEQPTNTSQTKVIWNIPHTMETGVDAEEVGVTHSRCC